MNNTGSKRTKLPQNHDEYEFLSPDTTHLSDDSKATNAVATHDSDFCFLKQGVGQDFLRKVSEGCIFQWQEDGCKRADNSWLMSGSQEQ